MKLNIEGVRPPRYAQAVLAAPQLVSPPVAGCRILGFGLRSVYAGKRS